MGWIVLALPLGALALLVMALLFNGARQFLIARSTTKKKKYSRNDVLRRRN